MLKTSYAPELNHLDNVWSYVQLNHLPNYAPRDVRELRERITAEFCCLKKLPDVRRPFQAHGTKP